jgi:hypothetical protein
VKFIALVPCQSFRKPELLQRRDRAVTLNRPSKIAKTELVGTLPKYSDEEADAKENDAIVRVWG